MIATSPRTASGCTSGTGLAMAKTIAPSAILRTASTEMAPGADTPTTTSAPSRASSARPRSPRGFVCCAIAIRSPSRSGRSGGRGGAPPRPGGFRLPPHPHPPPGGAGPVGVQDPADVAHHHVAHALLDDDLRAGHARRAGADDHHAHVLHALADDLQPVQERG